MADKKLDQQRDQKVAPREQQTIGQKPPRPDGSLEDSALDGVSGAARAAQAAIFTETVAARGADQKAARWAAFFIAADVGCR